MQKLLDKTGSYIENDPWQLVPEGQEIPRDGKYLLLPQASGWSRIRPGPSTRPGVSGSIAPTKWKP